MLLYYTKQGNIGEKNDMENFAKKYNVVFLLMRRHPLLTYVTILYQTR